MLFSLSFPEFSYEEHAGSLYFSFLQYSNLSHMIDYIQGSLYDYFVPLRKIAGCLPNKIFSDPEILTLCWMFNLYKSALRAIILHQSVLGLLIKFKRIS